MAVTETPMALRDEDGTVRAEYVERVALAVAAADSASLRELVGDLHEADVGDLIEAIDPDWTVGRTIDHLRDTSDLPDRFYELYVVDQTRRLKGAVALDRLLRTRRPVPVADLVDEELRPVRATDDQEEVARLFERYD